jgi:hypothetical protein
MAFQPISDSDKRLVAGEFRIRALPAWNGVLVFSDKDSGLDHPFLPFDAPATEIERPFD